MLQKLKSGKSLFPSARSTEPAKTAMSAIHDKVCQLLAIYVLKIVLS